jgi:stage II sporulation protein D
MKILFSICFIILTLFSGATEIKIGLFYGKNIESIVISVVEGEYSLCGNFSVIRSIESGSIFQIDQSDSKIYIHDADASFGPFERVTFVPKSRNAIFSVRPVFPALMAIESDDRIDILAEGSFLKLINSIDIEKYIAGTVEAEGGSNAMPEYYKAQAVLVRTFAVRNYYRHAHQGFNLCDDVHCQAYKGKSRMNKQIYFSAKQTEGVILSNRLGEPVITAYHSSCGGMTASASVEWNSDLDYLVPLSDPFCNKSKNLNWTRIIPAGEWNAYLTSTGYTGDGDIYGKDKGRVKYLDKTGNKIALTAIRRQFNLKSSWFSVVNDGNEVFFHGHGYGHGLGMCQEGAMEMARVGYTYVDILMFYFRGLKLSKK